jgi:hypothetical protein
LAETAVFLPDYQNPYELINPEPPFGYDLFTDRLHGWPLNVGESLKISGEKFPSYLRPKLDNPPQIPQGLSFIWTLPFQSPQILLSIIEKLALFGSVLVVTPLPELLNSLAENFAPIDCSQSPNENLKSPLPLSALALTNAPSSNQPLHRLSLTLALKAILVERAKQAQEAKKLHQEHKDKENDIAGQLEKLTRRSSLERALRLLKNEAHHKKPDWEMRDAFLTEAQADWAKYGQPPKGIAALIGRKARENRLKESRLRLEKAESEARESRLEMESLLSEIRTVEAQLAEIRDFTRDLPQPSELDAKLTSLRTEGQFLSAREAKLAADPPEPTLIKQALAKAQVFLASPSWVSDGRFEPTMLFDSVFIINPSVSGHSGRVQLAGEALRAKKNFVVASDFSAYCWLKPAPTDESGRPAWSNFMAAEIVSNPTPNRFKAIAALLDHLPELKPELSDRWLMPDPHPHSWLDQLGLGSALARLDVPSPLGFAFRVLGEDAPTSLATALTSLRLALEAAKNAGSDPYNRVYIITPSKGQTAVLRSLLTDLNRPENIFAGQTSDFDNWPQAGLVILDTAFTPPQTSHPWNSVDMGRVALIKALALSKGALAITAAKEAMEKLPLASFLSSLWKAPALSTWPGPTPTQSSALNEALDRAKDQVVAFLPPFEPSWWPQIGPHFMGALRRKLKVTIMATMPSEAELNYSDTAIRDLRLFGANVILSKGFSDLLVIIDRRFLTLASAVSLSLRRPIILNFELPNTSETLLNLMQLSTIAEKLGPGAPRNCPLCGWPYILINSDRPRGFADRQALKLGCLNQICPSAKKPRRLDERWPLTSPPTCQVDRLTSYELKRRGRHYEWICPKHPDSCPSLRQVPGDCPTYQPKTSYLADNDD